MLGLLLVIGFTIQMGLSVGYNISGEIEQATYYLIGASLFAFLLKWEVKG